MFDQVNALEVRWFLTEMVPNIKDPTPRRESGTPYSLWGKTGSPYESPRFLER